VHKYSNTGVPIYRFFLHNIVITKNNHYMVKYKCIKCSAIHNVTLNNILRKINRNIGKCRICKELDTLKRDKHSDFMKNKTHNKPPDKPIITLKDKLALDELSFENYDDDFKDNYFRRHMTSDEFAYFRPKIISFQNKKFKMDSDFIYYPTVSISNQTRFNPYVYSEDRSCLEKLNYFELKCDKCGFIFISRDLQTHKNRIKIFCKECNFTNNIFKLRTYQNLSQESILYQSKFELKFIRFCNDHKIYIINGPKIEYSKSGKKHVYRVDFAIPKLKYLIEIKDNHIWHRNQVNNGKWNAKIIGVTEFITNNEFYQDFKVIFPKNYVAETSSIIDKYWNS